MKRMLLLFAVCLILIPISSAEQANCDSRWEMSWLSAFTLAVEKYGQVECKWVEYPAEWIEYVKCTDIPLEKYPMLEGCSQDPRKFPNWDSFSDEAKKVTLKQYEKSKNGWLAIYQAPEEIHRVEADGTIVPDITIMPKAKFTDTKEEAIELMKTPLNRVCVAGAVSCDTSNAKSEPSKAFFYKLWMSIYYFLRGGDYPNRGEGLNFHEIKQDSAFKENSEDWR